MATEPLFKKVWQRPFVNIFKDLQVFEGKNCACVGDVKTKQVILCCLFEISLFLKGS